MDDEEVRRSWYHLEIGAREPICRAVESVTPLSVQGHYFSYFLTIRLDARCFGRGARALLEVRRRGKHPAAIVWSPLNKRRYHHEPGSPGLGFTYRCAVPHRVGTPPTLGFRRRTVSYEWACPFFHRPKISIASCVTRLTFLSWCPSTRRANWWRKFSVFFLEIFLELGWLRKNRTVKLHLSLSGATSTNFFLFIFQLLRK